MVLYFYKQDKFEVLYGKQENVSKELKNYKGKKALAIVGGKKVVPEIGLLKLKTLIACFEKKQDE